jgi:hypothetical protein
MIGTWSMAHAKGKSIKCGGKRRSFPQVTFLVISALRNLLSAGRLTGKLVRILAAVGQVWIAALFYLKASWDYDVHRQCCV